MKRIIKLISPALFPLIKAYWFIFRPSVSGAKIILTNGNDILFVKHTYGKKYTFPGGGIKRGESPEVAVKREVLEELGVSLGEVTPIKTFTDTGEFKKDTISVFTSEVFSKEVDTNNLEIEEAKWSSLENPPRVGRVAWEIMEIYRKYKRGM